MECVFSQLIKNMKDNDTYIPTDNTCYVKFLWKIQGEVIIEPVLRGFPMVVKDTTIFRKVDV